MPLSAWGEAVSCWPATSVRISYPRTGSSARICRCDSTWNVLAIFHVTWRGILKRVGRWGKISYSFLAQGAPADSASSILRGVRAIKAGMLLYLAGDVRWTGQLTESARFLGRTMRFSTTWVTLAAMTEAPVVMVFCRMEPDGRYHIEFREAFQIPKDVAARGEVRGWVQHFLDTLEVQVCRYPANSNEYFFWEEPGGMVA